MVSIEELRRAHGVVAELALKNPRLAPVFDRLDRELETRKTMPKLSALERTAQRIRDTRELI